MRSLSPSNRRITATTGRDEPGRLPAKAQALGRVWQAVHDGSSGSGDEKRRDGWLSTTAAGYLISPKGRVTTRGEVYIHPSTCPRDKRGNPSGTPMAVYGNTLSRAVSMAGS
jgi:hypothetical protein